MNHEDPAPRADEDDKPPSGPRWWRPFVRPSGPREWGPRFVGGPRLVENVNFPALQLNKNFLQFCDLPDNIKDIVTHYYYSTLRNTGHVEMWFNAKSCSEKETVLEVAAFKMQNHGPRGPEPPLPSHEKPSNQYLLEFE